MHIIFGRETAEELRARYTVVELETFRSDGQEVTGFCVLQPESVMAEIQDIERLCRMHQALVDSLNKRQFDTVLEGIGHLRGHFAGELDSFYDIIEQKIKRNDFA